MSRRTIPPDDVVLSGYDDVVDARRALVLAGYDLAYSPPGSPGLWVHRVTKRRLAVAQGRKSREWVIVKYPDDACVERDDVGPEIEPV